MKCMKKLPNKSADLNPGRRVIWGSVPNLDFQVSLMTRETIGDLIWAPINEEIVELIEPLEGQINEL